MRLEASSLFSNRPWFFGRSRRTSGVEGSPMIGGGASGVGEYPVVGGGGSGGVGRASDDTPDGGGDSEDNRFFALLGSRCSTVELYECEGTG